MTTVRGHVRKMKSGKLVEVIPHERQRGTYTPASFKKYEAKFKNLPGSQVYAPEKGTPPFTPSPAGLALTDIAGNIENQLNIPTHATMTGIHSDTPIITVDPGANKNVMFDFQFFKPAVELDEQYNFKTRAVVWRRNPHESSVINVIALKTFETLNKAINFAKRFI